MTRGACAAYGATRRRNPPHGRVTGAFLLALALFCGAACMRAAGVPRLHTPASPPGVDSVTVALWHMDETVGELVADAGPNRLDGFAGLDTGFDFGRFGGARVFVNSVQSFVFVPYQPVLETGGLLSIEAWVYLEDYGRFEDTPIAGRWTEQANERSWLFSIVGNKATLGSGVAAVTPGYHTDLVAFGSPGQVMFAMQPSFASGIQSYFSTSLVPLGRWVHVAVAYDGEVVRIYLDGRIDGQYVFPGRIRASTAPIIIGNSFDPRLLSDLESRSPVVIGNDPTGFYAFRGMIDELRISSVGRSGFENAQAR